MQELLTASEYTCRGAGATHGLVTLDKPNKTAKMLHKCKDTMATETKHVLPPSKVGLLFPYPRTLWQTNAFFCKVPGLGRVVQGDAGG